MGSANGEGERDDPADTGARRLRGPAAPRGVTTTERAVSQDHLVDLSRMLGEPTPHDPVRTPNEDTLR